jgi:hypothetical protein
LSYFLLPPPYWEFGIFVRKCLNCFHSEFKFCVPYLEPNLNLFENTNSIGSNIENDVVRYGIFQYRFHPYAQPWLPSHTCAPAAIPCSSFARLAHTRPLIMAMPPTDIGGPCPSGALGPALPLGNPLSGTMQFWPHGYAGVDGL